MIALQVNSALAMGKTILQTIGKPNRLVNRSDFVEAVWPFAENLESNIDLGKSTRLNGVYQGEGQGDVGFSTLLNVSTTRLLPKR